MQPRPALCLFIACVAAGCSAPEPVTLTYYVYDALSEDPVAGAEACEWPDADVCTTSDAEGMIEIQAEPGTDSFATLEAPDYYARFFSIETPTEDQFMGNNAMLSNVGVTLVLAMADLEQEPGTGVIGFSTFLEDQATGVSGVTPTSSPTLGAPFYTADGLAGFDMEATETTAVGAGAWLNVPPGDYVITFEGRPCTRVFGLEAEQENQVGLKVIANHWTQVDMLCIPETE